MASRWQRLIPEGVRLAIIEVVGGHGISWLLVLLHGTVYRGLGRPARGASIDWKRVIAICRKAPRDIVLSVECGTVEQAKRSIEHLRELTKEDRR